MYKCIKCSKEFKYKSDFNRHKSRKTPCDKDKILCKNYKCPKCYKTYTTKRSLSRHVNSFCKVKLNIENLQHQNPPNSQKQTPNSHQNPPNSQKQTPNSHQNDITINDEDRPTCKYCLKKFSRIDSLNRHIKSRCNQQKEIEEDREKIYQSLLDEMVNMKNQINKLTDENNSLKSKLAINMVNNTTNYTDNTINNNTINNNTFNIQLVAFGQEQLDHLTDRHYKYIINKGFKSIQELVKFIHFSKNKPENHNIYISNMRDNYVMIYNGKKWLLKDRAETINDLYDIKKSILIDKFDELINALPEHAIKKFNRFINDEQDDVISNNVKKEIKTILYNNKNIPEQTKKKLGLVTE